ncbi:MAG: hypothetical protein DME48_02810 [Verrucomicrobia bacterium]|nr:MAG: hypothetical protein DME48_02810 [Verrucomicrobiota bacterium]
MKAKTFAELSIEANPYLLPPLSAHYEWIGERTRPTHFLVLQLSPPFLMAKLCLIPPFSP